VRLLLRPGLELLVAAARPRLLALPRPRKSAHRARSVVHPLNRGRSTRSAARWSPIKAAPVRSVEVRRIKPSAVRLPAAAAVVARTAHHLAVAVAVVVARTDLRRIKVASVPAAVPRPEIRGLSVGRRTSTAALRSSSNTAVLLHSSSNTALRSKTLRSR
jgi:hypothetical protein